MKCKYGIWILPSGESGAQLQSLINQIADNYGSIKFIPHVSIAGMIVDDEDLNEVKEKVNQLAKRLNKFTIVLDEYGMKDEKHRCIYLLAKSDKLENVFREAVEMFPGAMVERNRTMPHLSIVYGEHSNSIKQDIIAQYQNLDIKFEAEGLDLCLSDGSEEEWRSVHHSEFSE